MFGFNLGEAAVDEFFYSRFTLSAALPLAIGLILFWFVIALLLYRESVILGLSFLDPKDLCLSNSFQKLSLSVNT